MDQSSSGIGYWKSPIGIIQMRSIGDALVSVSVCKEEPVQEELTRALVPEVIQQCICELEAYFGGILTRFTVKTTLEGTEFQRVVWKALQEIPYGKTNTYAEMAEKIGNPRACRAVGNANNRNPLLILVPCHRVIGADGSLTGYAAGLPIKEWLLNHEKQGVY